MVVRAWVVFLVVLVVPFAACAGSRAHESVKPGLVLDGERAAAGEPTAGLTGAFYADGDDGDIRAGTGNFGRTATTDDSTNALQAAGWDETPARQPATPSERLLVQHSQIQLEVARPDEAIAQFLAQVTAWGGYLKRQQGTTVTVRVPAARLDEAFVHLRAQGRVLSEARQADDVTEEYVDLGIRLDNARKARDRLLDVLQRADKVEDVLKVEVELRRLTEEIERMEGRRKFLADQVALATLQASFTAVAGASPGRRPRRPSRFDWLNRIGAERVMEGF